MKKLLVVNFLLGVLGSVTSLAGENLIRAQGEDFQVLNLKLSEAGPFSPADTAKVMTFKTEVEATNAVSELPKFDWGQIVGKHQEVFPKFVEATQTVAENAGITILSSTSRVKEAVSLKNKVFDRIAGNSRTTFVPGYAFNDIIGVRFLLKNEKDIKSLMDSLLKAPELTEFNLKARPTYDNINYAISADFKDIPYLGVDSYPYPSIGEIQVWAKPTGMWLDQQHDNVYKGDKSSVYYKELLNPFTSLHLFMCRILSTSDFQEKINNQSTEGVMEAFDTYVNAMEQADYTKKLTDAFWDNLPESWKGPQQGGRWTANSIQQALNKLEERDRFDLREYFVLS